MTLLEQWQAETHWSAPQRIREAAMMTATATRFEAKSKAERLQLLRQARDEVRRAATLTPNAALARVCRTAEHVLNQMIGRITVLFDLDQIRAYLEELTTMQAVRSLGTCVRLFAKDAAAAGVDRTPMTICLAASDT